MFNSYGGRRSFIRKRDYRIIQLLRELEEQSFTGLCEIILEIEEMVFEARVWYLWGLIVALQLFFSEKMLEGLRAFEFIKSNGLFMIKGMVWADVLRLDENELVFDYLIDNPSSLDKPLKSIAFFS